MEYGFSGYITKFLPQNSPFPIHEHFPSNDAHVNILKLGELEKNI
jgi:hypothetical protein